MTATASTPANDPATITLRVTTTTFALEWKVSGQKWDQIKAFIFAMMTETSRAQSDQKTEEMQRAAFGEPNERTEP